MNTTLTTSLTEQNRILSKEDIRVRVPSIYGYKAETLSDKYVFTPVHEVIDLFEKVGWYPTRVSGVKPSKRDVNTVKHLVRFAAKESIADVSLNGIVPEIVIINSHNGGCPLSAHLGFFRLVCANGLMVGTEISKMKWRHKKLDYNEAKQFMLTAMDEFREQSKFIPQYQKINLSKEQQINFAEKTIDMVWNGAQFEPELILTPKRMSDSASDLWTTFNVIQEHITKGGIRYKIPAERRTKPLHEFKTTHQIKNIDREVNVNLMLWGMMHNFYQEGKF